MKKEKLKKGHYLFTSESVSGSHPDKVADQIADSIIDNFIAYDKNSHCAVEVICTTGQVVVAGEVKSKAYVPIEEVVRETINRLGYTKAEYQFTGDSCGVLTAIHEQSPDIDMGVTKENPEEQGAGDNGIYFGYATNETPNYMPTTIDIANNIMYELKCERKEWEDIKYNGADPQADRQYMEYLRPDGKCMVTGEFDENEFQVFTYKDADGSYGYYLSLGHTTNILSIFGADSDSFSFGHMDETCLVMGGTADEALAFLDGLLDLIDKEPGSAAEFPCRLSTGAERLADAGTATCMVVKRFLQGKRLCFLFRSGERTAETDLTKGNIKALRSGITFYRKLHPDLI